MFLYITTAGYQLDGPLMDYYEKGTDVLNGVIESERTFYYLAEIDPEDDPDDPTAWIKANPSLGVTLKMEDMLEAWEERKHIPEERTDFITKRLNRFMQSAGEEGLVDYEIIQMNADSVDIAALQGAQCIGGFDLSDVEDFTSACLEFILPDQRVFVLSHSWIPERKVTQDNEKLPFQEWEEQGLLTICPGRYVKHELVYEWFVEMAKRYQINMIAYDPTKAYRLVEDLRNYGFPCQLVRQGALTLGPAVQDIQQLLLAGRVVYNRNPLFRWYLNNVRLVPDRGGNKFPTKQGRYRKIDGFAAWLNAHTEVMKNMGDQSEGGVEFVSISDLLRR